MHTSTDDPRHDTPAPHSGGPEHLAQMANDIGNFFRAEPSHEEAVAGIANHIQKYWTPRMRQKIFAQLDSHPSLLDPLPLAAVERLRQEQTLRQEQASKGAR